MNVVSIDKKAFYNNQDIKKVTFAENSKVTTIDSAAFARSVVSNITLPASLTTIDQSAFSNNIAIGKIAIPASVRSISSRAFEGCSSFETITFAENSQLSYIGDAALNYTNLRNINIPASVKSIGDYTFQNCKNLWMITIAKHSILTEIGAYAFATTDVTNFEVPEAVEKIGTNAFSFNNLDKTTITFKRLPSDDNSIVGYKSDMFGTTIPTIIVREGYEDAYRNQLKQTGDNANKVKGVAQTEYEDNGLLYKLFT